MQITLNGRSIPTCLFQTPFHSHFSHTVHSLLFQMFAFSVFDRKAQDQLLSKPPTWPPKTDPLRRSGKIGASPFPLLLGIFAFCSNSCLAGAFNCCWWFALKNSLYLPWGELGNRTHSYDKDNTIWTIHSLSQASLVAQLVKNPSAMWETCVWSLGWENPLEKGKGTHTSILAWRIPWTV